MYIFFANNYFISCLNRIEHAAQYSLNSQVGGALKKRSETVMFTVHVQNAMHNRLAVSCAIS